MVSVIACLRNHFLSQDQNDILLCYLLKFYCFTLNICYLNPSGIDFCIWSEVGIRSPPLPGPCIPADPASAFSHSSALLLWSLFITLPLLSWTRHSHMCRSVSGLFFFFLSVCLYSLFFFFLQPHLQQMEVPGPGAESELQLMAYTTATATLDLTYICNTCCSSWQHWILNPLSQAKYWTHILTETKLGP